MTTNPGRQAATTRWIVGHPWLGVFVAATFGFVSGCLCILIPAVTLLRDLFPPDSVDTFSYLSW